MVALDRRNYPLLVGLSGNAGSGKSTVADYLEHNYGFTPFAFADALKEWVGLGFRLDHDQLYGHRKEEIDPRYGVSPRYLLQWLGTDIIRAKWPNFWIDYLRHDMLEFLSTNGQRPLVVSDIRFKDEAQALVAMGAILVRLERDGNGDWQGNPLHLSETDLDGYRQWDFIIRNNGILEYLFAQIDAIVDHPGVAGLG